MLLMLCSSNKNRHRKGNISAYTHVLIRGREGLGESLKLEERITEKHVKTFLDIVVLALLNGEPMYGYKLIAAIHREFGILVSPGSFYPLLHFLEDNKLVESSFNKGKIVYKVTPKGKEKFEKTFTAYEASIERISHFVKVHGGISP
jgi:DNA-binding PadR family transcriptional regulator